jgi:hypothetical protein
VRFRDPELRAITLIEFEIVRRQQLAMLDMLAKAIAHGGE